MVIAPVQPVVCRPILETPGVWCTVRVWGGKEHRVSDRLKEMGIANYLPTERIRRIYRKRKVTVDQPYYPTYLFVAFTDDGQHFDVRRSLYVAEISRQHARQYERMVKKISDLQRMLCEEHIDKVERDKWVPGKRVRVVGGELCGIEGTICKRRGKDVIQVGYELLGSVATRDVDTLDCKLLEELT
jgi:transcription antitermination factor NusG